MACELIAVVTLEDVVEDDIVAKEVDADEERSGELVVDLGVLRLEALEALDGGGFSLTLEISAVGTGVIVAKFDMAK